MISKACHAFEQKLIYFENDLELIDVLSLAISDNTLTPASDSEFVLKELHKRLARRRNSHTSRLQLINHLRQSIYSSYIKDVYEEVTCYFRIMMEKYFKGNIDSARVIGEHTLKLDAKAVLALGNWDAVCRHVASSVLQSLEAERSTLALFKKVKNKLGIEIDDSMIDEALPYLEVRHFLVHSDGVLSAEFIGQYPFIELSANNVIKLTPDFIKNLTTKTKKIIRHYDKQIIRRNVLLQEDIAGSRTSPS